MSILKSFCYTICYYYLFVFGFYSLLFVGIAHARHASRNSSHNSANNVNQTADMLLGRELASRIEELTNHWACSSPKPRLVYVSEENPTKITSYTRWFPPVAVLHRCEENLGCCLNHPEDRCKPLRSEQVSVLFKHINELTNEQTYERLTFTNHTECGCLSGNALLNTNSSTTTTESNSSSTTISTTTTSISLNSEVNLTSINNSTTVPTDNLESTTSSTETSSSPSSSVTR